MIQEAKGGSQGMRIAFCELSDEEVAALAGSFNYELLCDLGKRIPRVYFRHGEMIGSKDYFEDDWLFFAAAADQI